MQAKLSPEVLAGPFIQECLDVFREKLDIYDRFFRELARREKGQDGRCPPGQLYLPVVLDKEEEKERGAEP